MNSDLPGFYELTVEERLEKLKEVACLSSGDMKTIKNGLNINTANRMIENVIGMIQIPMGIATNFRINGKDYLIPMALEEPSVIAAASHAAKLCRPTGGFVADADEPLMIGQIQLVDVPDIEAARKIVHNNTKKIKEISNSKDSIMVKLGGGLREVEARVVGNMLIVHLIVDVRDAMGANAVNTMAEAVAPFLEDLTGGKARLKIISNLATRRLVRAEAVWPRAALGDEIINGIIDAYRFAVADPYRCATNNKGIMNGVDAVAIATCNDFRALEAAAHHYCDFGEGPLAKYWADEQGLHGRIELPITAGTVGGAVNTHPVAKVALKILGVKSARELACVMASVGLANNFAALRAMIKEGIQKGHMKLHAENIAIIAGCHGDDVKRIAQQMVDDGMISVSRAKELIENGG